MYNLHAVEVPVIHIRLILHLECLPRLRQEILHFALKCHSYFGLWDDVSVQNVKTELRQEIGSAIKQPKILKCQQYHISYHHTLAQNIFSIVLCANFNFISQESQSNLLKFISEAI